MVAAMAPSHPLARTQAVSAKALQGEHFVGFDQDLPIQDHIDRYFREQKVTIQTVMRFDNMQMIKEAVAHAAGISIMPRRVMGEELRQGRLVALTLKPAELFRPVGIIHRRRKVFNQVASGLLALLREKEHAPE